MYTLMLNSTNSNSIAIAKRRGVFNFAPFLSVLLLTACPLAVFCESRGEKIDQLSAIQAEQTIRITQLEESIRALQGKIEELEYRLSGKRIDKPVVIQQTPTVPTKPSFINNAQPQSSTAPAASTITGMPSVVPADLYQEDLAFAASYDPEVAESFTKSLNYLEKGITNSALSEINAAIDLNLNKRETSRLLLWKGIIYEAMSDTARAIKTYNDLSLKYPQELRSRTALLRQGSLFIRLNEKELAKITFDKLIADYPGSEEAKKAKQRKLDLK